MTDSDHGQRPTPPYEAIKAADANEYDNNCGGGGGGGGGGRGGEASSFSVFAMQRCSRGLTIDQGCNTGGDGGGAAAAEDGDGREAAARMAAAATYNFIQHYLSQ